MAVRSVTGSFETLVADIGATNARFAIADATGRLRDVTVLSTPSLAAGADLVPLLREHFDLDALAGASFAVAGPVTDGEAAITNGALRLQEASLARALGRPVRLLNDFHALAHGLDRFEKLTPVGGGRAVPGAVRAVLGPGSGLGMSVCVPPARGEGADRVVPSEGGHARLAPAGPLEAEVVRLLLEGRDYVCWEAVLSGPGLVLLYETLARLWGSAPAPDAEPVSAAWITEHAVDAREPLCHQTVELFLSFLGTAAGDLALMAYARGGVYIAGGIVPRLLSQVAESPLRRRFEERGALSAFAAAIPLFIVCDPYPGLVGAWAAFQDAERPD